MLKAFDIHRRPRPKSPVPDRVHDRRSGVGLFLLLFAVAVIVSLFSARVASDPVSFVSSPAISATGTPLANSSANPFDTASPRTSLGPTLPSMPTTTPSPTPIAEPTPEPTTEPSKSAITMRILNGSGTAGQAALLRTQLQKDGFTVRSIATARTRRATTMIYYASGKRPEAEYVASFITGRVLEFEESANLTTPDTLLVIVGTK